MTAPAVRWPGADDLADRLGQCYELALLLVAENRMLRAHVIHGLVQPLPSRPPLLHAWVVSRNHVYDPVVRVAVPVDVYRDEYRAKPLVVYAAMTALNLVETHGHVGPWDAESLRIAEIPAAERIERLAEAMPT